MGLIEATTKNLSSCLLEIDFSDSNSLLLIAAAALLVQCTILYYVIKGAVSSALQKQKKELLTAIKKGNYLKLLELRKAGINDEEIKQAMEQLNEHNRLNELYYNGSIKFEEYQEKKSQLILE